MQDHTTSRCADSVWVVYWHNNTASDLTTANRAVLHVFVPSNGRTVVREYVLPADRMQLLRDLRAFETVFEAGKRERSKELLATLGGQPLTGR